MRIYRWLQAVALSSLLLAAPASADSLLDLFDAAPAPPTNAASAQAWVREGRVVTPQLAALDARLKAATTQSLANVPAPDAAAVQIAVDLYQAYVAANSGDQAPAAALGSRANWLSGRYAGLRKRTSDADLARIQEIKEQELASFRALFTDWKTQRRGLVAEAQAALSGVGDSSQIASAPQRAAVEQYRAAMLQEIQVLMNLTRLSAERAAGLPSAEPSTVQPGANTLWDLMRNPQRSSP
ncbi:MAG: hypothetical protein ACT4PG_05140 [Panacagrimonas sp.]